MTFDSLEGEPAIFPEIEAPEARLARAFGGLGVGPVGGVAWIVEALSAVVGGVIRADRFDCRWGPSGLRRPGVVAQLGWPRLGTRVGLGIDPPLAHALVDQLLGHPRAEAESKLQVSPVEWGILSFLIARGLDRLESAPDGPLGPWDLTIDRVGPDPLDAAGLGPLVTWRWRVDVEGRAGSARLWLPEKLLAGWLDEADPADIDAPIIRPARSVAELGGDWHAEAGTVKLAAGSHRKRLQPGGLLLIEGSPLSGTARNPEGIIELARVVGPTRLSFSTRAEPGSDARRLVVESATVCRAEVAINASSTADSASIADDQEARLTVELGRVNLPEGRVASLRAGEVIELARHETEPVDLTLNGRVVARGKLVQVDTELGVRVLSVFC